MNQSQFEVTFSATFLIPGIYKTNCRVCECHFKKDFSFDSKLHYYMPIYVYMIF